MNNNLLNIEDNPKEAANDFNNYFTKVGENLAKKFSKNPDLVFDLSNKKIPISFDKVFLDKVDVSELSLIILNYKDDTAAGYDKVTVNI